VSDAPIGGSALGGSDDEDADDAGTYTTRASAVRVRAAALRE